MKRCELCNSVAKLYCDSDRAILCWHCDAKVHSANFLVAKHSRSLLCRLCQRPTPWSAAGANLGPTASICQRCLKRRSLHGHNPESDDELSGNEDEEEEEEEEKTEDGGEEDEEYQVVPCSVSSSSQSRTKFAEQTAESSAQGDLGSFFSQHHQDVDRVKEATFSDTVVP